MHDFMCKQEKGFAWNDQERGRFRTDFFPPVDFPTIPHTPWIQKNIAVPPSIYDEVCCVKRLTLASTSDQTHPIGLVGFVS
jgi:hypothetical protein